MRWLIPFLLPLALAAPSAAQDRSRLPTIAAAGPPLQALTTAEANRRWQAIGRLDFGRGFCTGTLIAADLVLTAAHCLFDADTGTRMPEAAIRFNAGLRNGRPEALRTVRRSVVHPDYRYGTPDDLGRVRSDLALLELDRPIPSGTIVPVPAHGGVRPGDVVRVVSYGAEREEVASLEEDCLVLAGDPGVLVLSCHVDPGSSGAPILIERAGRLSVVSVVSARATWRGEAVALSAELDGGIAPLLDLMERTDDVFSREAARVRTLSTGQDGRDGIGARFLRP